VATWAASRRPPIWAPSGIRPTTSPFRHVARCSKLWVAKINGLCHAGALGLVLHCDVTVAADTARFRVPELLRGIPDPFITSRLAATVGTARAAYLCFTAGEVDAPTALAMGLVGAVVPAAELDSHVEWVLAQIAKTGPAARTTIKRELNRQIPTHDPYMFSDSLGTPEMHEGIAAFVEKRPIAWPRPTH